MSLVALLLFVGLAIDAGVVYVSYGQLKRAIDSAAVASANNFKTGKSELEMKVAALEVLRLHNVDTASLDLNVQICDDNRDGYRDDALQVDAPRFFMQCPLTDPVNLPGSYSASPRKLVYVEANQRVPFYFLTLLGVHDIALRTDATAEAAPIDLVLVIDTSESMATECDTKDPITGACAFFKSPGFTQDTIEDYEPNLAGNCNTSNQCHPLLEAKEAAKALVDTLYGGYDNIGIVTFDTVAVDVGGGLVNTIQSGDIKLAIDNIKLHDDAPYARLWPYWREPGRFNPINPEDRDGDGSDYDDPLKLGYTCNLDDDRWDSKPEREARGLIPPESDPFGWNGVPCDDDNLLDAYNWDDENTDLDGNRDSNPTYTAADTQGIVNYLSANDPDGGGPLTASLSITSTCTGCAMRTASNILKAHGRPGAVWVIIFLSDGYANMSDTNATSGGLVPSGYTNGFCSGRLTNNSTLTGFWPSFCVDRDLTTRFCVDTTASTCAPHTTWVNDPDPRFSVEDYARDMTDAAALMVRQSTNPSDTRYSLNEPLGNDIAIYSIGLGGVTPDQSYLDNPLANPLGVNLGTGEKMLRYMAAVGDDGDRVTDPCRAGGTSAGLPITAKRSCGNYYYAPAGADLIPIFEDIATRIYTRLSQ